LVTVVSLLPLSNMIKVAKTDVWSHSTTLAPDLHGAACEVVNEFALCSIGNLHSNSFVPHLPQFDGCDCF
jgi:hypothetical protein